MHDALCVSCLQNEGNIIGPCYTHYRLDIELLESPPSIAYLHLRSSSTFQEVHSPFKSGMRTIDTTFSCLEAKSVAAQWTMENIKKIHWFNVD